MCNKIKKPSFLVYYDNEVIVLRLRDDEAGRLFKSLFPYGRDEIKPDFDKSPALAMAFDILSMAIDRDKEKYQNTCEQNRENGRKGGRPKKNQTDIEKTEKSGRLISKPKKADKDKEKEEDKDISYSYPYPLKEGETLPPSADAGGASTFTLSDCEECAKKGKVNLSESGIRVFYERMEKDGWKIKGSPVENLLMAMRGFAKNHKQHQKQTADSQEKKLPKKVFKSFKPWLKYHGYDSNYENGFADYDEEITIDKEMMDIVWSVDNLSESMQSINERLADSGYGQEEIKPLMQLFLKWSKEKKEER